MCEHHGTGKIQVFNDLLVSLGRIALGIGAGLLLIFLGLVLMSVSKEVHGAPIGLEPCEQKQLVTKRKTSDGKSTIAAWVTVRSGRTDKIQCTDEEVVWTLPDPTIEAPVPYAVVPGLFETEEDAPNVRLFWPPIGRVTWVPLWIVIERPVTPLPPPEDQEPELPPPPPKEVVPVPTQQPVPVPPEVPVPVPLPGSLVLVAAGLIGTIRRARA